MKTTLLIYVVTGIEQQKNRRILYGGFWSGRWDSNPGPLQPHCSALAGLRHAPMSEADYSAFPVLWQANSLACWCVGALVHLCIGTLVRWLQVDQLR